MRLALISLGLFATLSGAASAQGTWNAFALDYRGGYGIGVGQSSESAAREAALAECPGRDCEVVFTAESQCVAVADNRNNGYWYGYAWGDTQRGTETIALGYCIEHDQGECSPLASACISSGERKLPTTDSSSSKNKL